MKDKIPGRVKHYYCFLGAKWCDFTFFPPQQSIVAGSGSPACLVSRAWSLRGPARLRGPPLVSRRPAGSPRMKLVWNTRTVGDLDKLLWQSTLIVLSLAPGAVPNMAAPPLGRAGPEPAPLPLIWRGGAPGAASPTLQPGAQRGRTPGPGARPAHYQPRTHTPLSVSLFWSRHNLKLALVI